MFLSCRLSVPTAFVFASMGAVLCKLMWTSQIQTTNVIVGNMTSIEELESKANVDFASWQAVQTWNNNVFCGQL